MDKKKILVIDDDAATHDVVAEFVELGRLFNDPILDHVRPLDVVKADL